MNSNFNFDQIPNNVMVELPEGEHNLFIKKCEYLISSQNNKMLQFTYGIENSDTEIRFDNCVVEMSDGKINNVGQVKLKRIIQAIGLGEELRGKPPVPFNMLPNLILSKERWFKAEIKKDDKGYYKLGSFDTFKPIEKNITVTPQTFNVQQTTELQNTTENQNSTNINVQASWDINN